ncbi:MAG: hypothetical protein ACRD2N_25640 [Vicinamibacterales bacterium]
MTDRAKDRDDALTVRDRRRIRLARLGVTLRARRARKHFAVPQLLARMQVQRVDAPAVTRQILHRCHVAVESRAKRRILVARRGDDDDAVAPDDRAGNGETGDGRLPPDVAAGRDVPIGDGALTVRSAGSVCATKRRPWASALGNAGVASTRDRGSVDVAGEAPADGTGAAGSAAVDVASANPSRAYPTDVVPRVIAIRSTRPPRPANTMVTSGALAALN